MGSDEKVTDRAELDRRAVVVGGGTTLIGLGLLTAGCGTAAAAAAHPDAAGQRGRGAKPGRTAGWRTGQRGGRARRRRHRLSRRQGRRHAAAGGHLRRALGHLYAHGMRRAGCVRRHDQLPVSRQPVQP